MTVPTEHIEQVNLINWIRHNHPNHWVFAVPNGERRAVSVGKRLKAEGVSKGVPDLFIPSLKLFIEMKRLKGSDTRKEQKIWIEYLKLNGYGAEICKGAEAAKKIITERINEI